MQKKLRAAVTKAGFNPIKVGVWENETHILLKRNKFGQPWQAIHKLTGKQSSYSSLSDAVYHTRTA